MPSPPPRRAPTRRSPAAPQVEAFLLEQAPSAPEAAEEEEDDDEAAGCAVRAARRSRCGDSPAAALSRESWQPDAAPVQGQGQGQKAQDGRLSSAGAAPPQRLATGGASASDAPSALHHQRVTRAAKLLPAPPAARAAAPRALAQALSRIALAGAFGADGGLHGRSRGAPQRGGQALVGAHQGQLAERACACVQLCGTTQLTPFLRARAERPQDPLRRHATGASRLVRRTPPRR